jgi:hypothetical protein
MDKNYVMLETMKFLEEHPHTNFMEILEQLEKVLAEKGELEKYHGDRHITDGIIKKNTELILLLEEIKWDLIIKRVITPGEDISFRTPELRVSDMEYLKHLIKTYATEV